MEWFTAQAPAEAFLEPLWTRLAASLVPVHAVEVPTDPARATGILEGIRNSARGGRFPQGDDSNGKQEGIGDRRGGGAEGGEANGKQEHVGGRGGGGPHGGDSSGKREDVGEGMVGVGQAMSLAQYVAEVSAFDVVISANSLDDVPTKVRTRGKNDLVGRKVVFDGVCLQDVEHT